MSGDFSVSMNKIVVSFNRVILSLEIEGIKLVSMFNLSKANFLILLKRHIKRTNRKNSLV